MSARIIPWISPEEHLTYERTADVRHEYVHGERFPKAEDTLRHNAVVGNCVLAIRPAAQRRGYATYALTVALRIEVVNAFYYPDIVVAHRSDDADARVVHEPLLIVEVLSDATEAIDCREKRVNYQKVASLREYVLIAQDKRRIEVYRRTALGWICEIVTEGELVLESIGTTVALDDVYA